MKTIFIGLFLLSTYSAHAEIKTKEQADNFLNGYCIGLVNEIEKAVGKQKQQAAQQDWKKFMETGSWIVGIADVYNKLCK
jgi:hypothetical protein